jgi:hypothetical protein
MPTWRAAEQLLFAHEDDDGSDAPDGLPDYLTEKHLKHPPPRAIDRDDGLPPLHGEVRQPDPR